MGKTHVANVDDFSPLGAGGSKISERVGRDGAGRGLETWAARSTSTEASTTKAASETTTSSAKTTAASKSSSKSSAHATAIATSATEAHARSTAGITVLADFNNTTLPVIAVKLLNGVAGIIWAFKDDNARTLRATIRSDVYISSNHGAVSGYITIRSNRAQSCVQMRRIKTYLLDGTSPSNPASQH